MLTRCLSVSVASSLHSIPGATCKRGHERANARRFLSPPACVGVTLFPGDRNYSSPGASDERVWNETGCTCLLITSTKDTLR
jgi:hypothetical protein